MRPVVRQCTFSLKNVQLILVHILHIGKHNKKISILTVISFLLICYIMKLAIIKTVRVNVHKRTTSFSSTTRITCSSDMIKENSSVSRQDWDFRLFKRPTFLKNFKNPCFFQNVTMRVDGSPTLNGQLRLRCLPYFLIAGFPKSGTTDLWVRLLNHPEIKLRHPKEPRFFNFGRYREGSYANAAAKYISLFDKASTELHRLVAPVECKDHPFPFYHGITGEGTVDTVFDNNFWQHVPGNEHCMEPIITNADYAYHINPNMKIIFMVRNPVERLYSDYIYEARYIRYPLSSQLFHEAVIDAIKNHTDCRKYTTIRACAYNGTIETFKIRLRVGMYSVFIKDWLQVFQPENILVVKAEDTFGPKKYRTYRRIFEFLNIRPFTKLEEVNIFHRGAVNTRSSREKRIGDMLPETRKLIEQFYEPFNKELVKMFPDIDYTNV
ncbi:carbohydrate sulfotransferase 15-like [Ruditapes philippinarum]|uniref:carbohydrate sulfotransferase 15-like n=1 Tax=Ruditapes philippinarum TaxID=129788 RepID=UPI00295B545E|nr:carbohydrate sulfotransferase 15-like [Ruditapes philippinarum]